MFCQEFDQILCNDDLHEILMPSSREDQQSNGTSSKERCKSNEFKLQQAQQMKKHEERKLRFMREGSRAFENKLASHSYSDTETEPICEAKKSILQIKPMIT